MKGKVIVSDEATKELFQLQLLQLIEAKQKELDQFDREMDAEPFPRLLTDGELEARNKILRELLEYCEMRDKFFPEPDEAEARFVEERRRGKIY